MAIHKAGTVLVQAKSLMFSLTNVSSAGKRYALQIFCAIRHETSPGQILNSSCHEFVDKTDVLL